MHDCLTIQEIVSKICLEAWLDNDEFNRGRKAVVALSLTCRTLYEPATNVIWYSIPTIQPLLVSIPKMLAVEAVSQDDEEREIRRIPIRKSDLTRMRQLAKRIRCLAWDPSITRGSFTQHMEKLARYVHQSVATVHYQTLQLVLNGERLLPQIRTVNLGQIDPELLPYIPLLTGPSITELSFAAHLSEFSADDTFQLFSFLNLMGEHFPRLERLDFHIENRSYRDYDAVSAELAAVISLSKWSNLSRLCVGEAVSREGIPPLLSLPLQELRIKVASCEDSRLFPDPSVLPTRPTLFHLKILEFCARYLSMAVELFAQFPVGINLSEIRIETFPQWTTTSTGDIWIALCHNIQQKCLPNSVHYVYINDRIGTEDNDAYQPSFELGLDALKYFLPFSNIRAISIKTCGTLNIGNSELNCIAFALTKVTSVELLGHPDAATGPKTTLEGLEAFADHCCYLKHLSIQFQGHATRYSRSQGRPRHSLQLHTFDVQDSTISSPMMVAAFLADIFPTIENVIWCNSPLEGNGNAPELWAQTKEFHEAFAQARADEAVRYMVGAQHW